MNSTWSILEKSTGELKVTCTGDKWATAQKKAFDKLAKEVKIDGFRKGHAPKKMIEKQISEQGILMEAVELVASDCLIVGLEEQGIELVARPELGVDNISKDSVDFVFKCTVKPEVKLGQYKNLEVKKDKVKIDAKMVDAEIKKYCEQMAELVVKDEGEVVDGNTVVIDFAGYLNDEAFEGGSAENYPLEIGSGSFIPGFEEQIIGCKLGEEKEVNVTFPAEYQAENLAGQAVVFKVKVNEIKEKQIPTLTDEFVVELNKNDAKTVEELKLSVKNELTEKAEKEANVKFENDLLAKVVEGSEVDIPEQMVNDEIEFLYQNFTSNIAQQGINEEMYFQFTGQTKESVREQLSVDAFNKVKLRLVLETIAKTENVVVDEVEINDEYQKIADQYKMELDKVKEAIGPETLKNDVALRKAMDIINNSVSK